jgi:hypothetical protein
METRKKEQNNPGKKIGRKVEIKGDRINYVQHV